MTEKLWKLLSLFGTTLTYLENATHFMYRLVIVQVLKLLKIYDSNFTKYKDLYNYPRFTDKMVKFQNFSGLCEIICSALFPNYSFFGSVCKTVMKIFCDTFKSSFQNHMSK